MKYSKVLRDQQTEISRIDTSLWCPRREEAFIDLNSPLAQIVIGVRRSGKSTLCQKVMIESKVKFAYVNFDDERLASVKTEELNDILQELYAVYGKFTHLLLDEVQNIEAWPLFVNRLLRQQVRLILTGSNANMLSSELITHMTGRYNLVVLFPFSFAEFCRVKNVNILSETTEACGLREYALNEYLKSGGFPEIVQIPSLSPRVYVQSLLRAIVEKDICKRYNVKYKQTIYSLANHLLDWYCQEKSYTSIADDLNIKSVHTVSNYLSYLDNAYLLRPLTRYTFKTVERATLRKWYAVDISFISDREQTLQTEGLGWRLENVVAIELMRRLENEAQELFYIRESRNYEVDFAVVEQGHVIQLIQVTYDFSDPSAKLYNREIGGLQKAAAAVRCNNLLLIMSSGEPQTIELGNGYTVQCVLATDWLLNRSQSQS